MLEVKLVDVLGSEEWAALGVGRGEHGGDQASGARSGDHIEVSAILTSDPSNSYAPQQPKIHWRG